MITQDWIDALPAWTPYDDLHRRTPASEYWTLERWRLAVDRSLMIGQSNVWELRGCLMDALNNGLRMKADFRLNCGALVLALMRKNVAPRWSGLVAFRGRGLIESFDYEEIGNDVDANSVCRDLLLWDLVWLRFQELEAARLKSDFDLRDEVFTRLVNQTLGRKPYLKEPELVRGLGCNEILNGELRKKIDALEKGNERKKILGIDEEIEMIESLITMKASAERKRLIAEDRALRRFAVGVGGLIGPRTRFARGADVYEMLTGVRLDRANFRRDLGLK